MDSILILVKEKTLYIHLGEILRKGELTISNVPGNQLYKTIISDSNYEIVSFDQPPGKYWLSVETGNSITKKSFHLK